MGALLFLVLAAAAHGQTGCHDPLAAAVTTIPVPGRPFGIAVSPDGCHAFVSLITGKTGAVAVLRRAGGRIEAARTAALPNSGAGITITHDGKLVIVAAIERVIFLDAARLISGEGDPIVGSFSDGPEVQSIYANTTADDKLLFVSEERTAAITVIDLERARANGFKPDAIVGKIPAAHAPIALTFSPDGRWLYTTSQVALKEWGWPAACKPEGRAGVTRLVNPEGAVIVIDVGRAKSDPAHAVAGRVPAGCSPVRMAISPSGDRIYVTARNSNAVAAFETAKLLDDPAQARLGMAPVGTAPVPIAVIDGGRRVVAGNSNRFGGGEAGESLTILDAAKIQGNADARIGTVAAGAFPRELRLSPDGSALYLANFGSGSVQVMDPARLK